LPKKFGRNHGNYETICTNGSDCRSFSFDDLNLYFGISEIKKGELSNILFINDLLNPLDAVLEDAALKRKQSMFKVGKVSETESIKYQLASKMVTITEPFQKTYTWEEDDSFQPPAWAKGRKTLDAELEAELKTTPFETYNLTRGKVNGFLGSKIKTVGRIKGLVRIIETKEEVETNPLLPKDLLDLLMKPKSYIIRLYVLRGKDIAAMDSDMFGNPANSDPYIKVSLGELLFHLFAL
jgi:hypothetical protein